MLCKEAIRHCHLHWLQVGHDPGAFTRGRYRLGIGRTHTQGNQSFEPGVAVIDPPLYHEAAQPPPYPAREIPQNRGSLYQPVVSKPTSQEGVEFLNHLFQGYSPGTPGDGSDPYLDPFESLAAQLDPGLLPRGEAKSQKTSVLGLGHGALFPVHAQLQPFGQEPLNGAQHPLPGTLGPHIYVTVSSPGESHPQALAEPGVNLSTHRAPIIQPMAKSPSASERTAVVRDERSDPTSVPPGVCGD